MRRASHCPLINTLNRSGHQTAALHSFHAWFLTSPFPRLGHPGGHGPKVSTWDGGRCPLVCYAVYLLFVDRTWPWDIADASEAPGVGAADRPL